MIFNCGYPQQFHRVLKPNGVAVLAVWDKDPNSIWVKLFRVVAKLQGAFYLPPSSIGWIKSDNSNMNMVHIPSMVPVSSHLCPKTPDHLDAGRSRFGSQDGRQTGFSFVDSTDWMQHPTFIVPVCISLERISYGRQPVSIWTARHPSESATR